MLDLHLIKDKVEFFEAENLRQLEKDINLKIEQNQALLLEVHSVSHHVSHDDKTGRPHYSAVVHFKAAKS